jgi:hypothetical protein
LQLLLEFISLDFGSSPADVQQEDAMKLARDGSGQKLEIGILYIKGGQK